MSQHIADRIQFIIKELGMNFNSFSKAIGLANNTTIGRIVNEKRKPSFEILEKIQHKYSNINAKWLLTGEGKPFLSEHDHSKSLTHKQKIIKYLNSKGISKNQFYNTTGFANGFLDSGDNINSDKIPIIKSCYSDLNTDWLLLDQGLMTISDSNTLAEPHVEYSNPSFDVLAYLKDKDKELFKAIEENGRLKQRIDDLTKKKH